MKKTDSYQRPGISVLICTFNGAAVVGETLKSLSQQADMEDISWEIILVDNASTDDTATVARQQWSTFSNKPCELRIVTENRPGKIRALLTGIAESQYPFLVICDDDNRLIYNYLSYGYQILNNNPQIGVLGGVGIADFETGQPTWFEKYQMYYAVGKQAAEGGDISHSRGWVNGAGSFIRKVAIEGIENFKFASHGIGRKGIGMVGGEDVEFCYYALLKGYKIWYNENLLFHHFINKKKADISYLGKLFESGPRSAYLLDGLAYRAKANKGWFDKKYKRNWVFRLIRDSLDFKIFGHSEFPFSFLLKLYFLRMKSIIKLNFKYDRSFYGH